LKREFSAGGVVVRRFRGRPFGAAVAPREGVLALPKGHPDGRETMEQAAAREVREETGLDAELVEKLDDVRYWYTRGGERVFKVVRFYLFRYRSGSIADHDHEIERVEWVPLEELPERLSYAGERNVARKALERASR
jgi:8-oxo-dGTP pyrophosphatase MutT (NUDIX family)